MLLIQNGYMVDPKSGREGKVDILTDGGKIQQIGEGLSKPCQKCEVIDAKGLLAAPGLVDVHVHFREPGFTHKEDISTGAAAAAKGGFTTVVLMANTKPVVDNEETLKFVLERGRQTGIHVLTCANVTAGMKGQKLTDMEALAKAGAVGFTDDGVPLMEESVVRKAMEEAARLNLPISFHEEDPGLIENNGINRGKASAHFGIGGSPREAEITLVERDLKLALETGAHINIQHISAKESVELIRSAAQCNATQHSAVQYSTTQRNAAQHNTVQHRNIHAEATPHHFALTEDAAIRYGTLAKMNPPLREEEDRLAIITGLADGTIDIIATDHAPHAAEEKAKPITEAPSGIIGLETALPLGITVLVEGGYLTMKELLRKMSTNPASLYHLDAGYLAEGGPADIVLIDPKEKAVVDSFVSKASNSPFVGWELTGKVKVTICNGKVVYQDDADKK